jgi:hypothetical protein
MACGVRRVACGAVCCGAVIEIVWGVVCGRHVKREVCVGGVAGGLSGDNGELRNVGDVGVRGRLLIGTAFVSRHTTAKRH